MKKAIICSMVCLAAGLSVALAAGEGKLRFPWADAAMNSQADISNVELECLKATFTAVEALEWNVKGFRFAIMSIVPKPTEEGMELTVEMELPEAKLRPDFLRTCVSQAFYAARETWYKRRPSSLAKSGRPVIILMSKGKELMRDDAERPRIK